MSVGQSFDLDVTLFDVAGQHDGTPMTISSVVGSVAVGGLTFDLSTFIAGGVVTSNLDGTARDVGVRLGGGGPSVNGFDFGSLTLLFETSSNPIAIGGSLPDAMLANDVSPENLAVAFSFDRAVPPFDRAFADNLTLVGGRFVYDTDTFSTTAVAVPVPGTVALFGLCLVGLVSARRARVQRHRLETRVRREPLRWPAVRAAS